MWKIGITYATLNPTRTNNVMHGAVSSMQRKMHTIDDNLNDPTNKCTFDLRNTKKLLLITARDNLSALSGSYLQRFT